MSNLLIAAYALSTSLALVFLKLGSQSAALIAIVDNKLNLNLNLYNLSGIILYVTSFLIYTFLISKFELGYIIPLVTALVYVLVFIASFTIFKESFSTIKVIAIGLILIGIILLNTNKQ